MKIQDLLGEEYFEETSYSKNVEKSDTKYIGSSEEYDEGNDVMFCHQVIIETLEKGIKIVFRMFSASIWPGSGQEMGTASYSEYETTIAYTDAKEIERLKEYWTEYGTGMSEFMPREDWKTKSISFAPLSEIAVPTKLN